MTDDGGPLTGQRRVCVFARLWEPGLGDLIQREIFLSLLKQAYRLRAALAPDLQPDWDALISDILAEACRDPEDEAAPEPAA